MGRVVVECDAAAGLEANDVAAHPCSQGIGTGMLDKFELNAAVTENLEAVVVGPANVLSCAARGIAFEVVVLLPYREIRVVCLGEPSDFRPVRRAQSPHARYVGHGDP